jgi:alpha-D-xyloside xylohydrolase
MKLQSCAMARLTLSIAMAATLAAQSFAASDQRPRWFNQPLDISPDFHQAGNDLYRADRLAGFDPAEGTGTIVWQRTALGRGFAFNNETPSWRDAGANEFPRNIYAVNPGLPFSIEFVSPRTVRLRLRTAQMAAPERESPMLAGPVGTSDAWRYEKLDGGHRFTGPAGSVAIRERPWRIEWRDGSGRLLTHTYHVSDNLGYFPFPPFSFIRRASDFSRSIDAVFLLSPGEKIFGCGEAFGPLDKVGQRVVLSTTDASGAESGGMYKPVPFFMSSRGYGMFIHTSTPVTCDFGVAHNDAASLTIGDDTLDLFVFLGSPSEILDEYTNLTGKSPVPPLWSFGFWMSRITYQSEAEVRDVAAKLRQNRIPCDVIHLDTGWFENDWQCDYEFSKNRFSDPAKMIADLKAMGLRVCLWQLPYFIPQNKLFGEILDKRLFVRDETGGLPTEDAILDFSNPETVAWYQEKLAALLEMGVGAIKVDFGEAAPLAGIYASGRTGFYEHNLYPLRYNKAAADVTKRVTGENIIWARSAWAGSQRYPLHWGGDAASSDAGMAATLRGGLSFGLSGFAFWSHDMGGFTRRPDVELYRRWMAFGFLTSHSRTHGQPPREPWEYGKEFEDDFRSADELRYRLMPYIYAQAVDSSQRGLPMLRALFIDFPDDPGAWLIEDQYLFGTDLLVAPLMHAVETARSVYLPGDGRWIDYQTGTTYDPGWRTIEAGPVPVVVLAREGAAIAHIPLAQSTAEMDWSRLELTVFGEAEQAHGLVALPADNVLRPLTLARREGRYVLATDPLSGRVAWKIGTTSLQ